jgi:hypothetical protein
MKSRFIRYITKATLCAAVLLATGWFAQPANAQVGFRGKFTLPYEARWGQAVLPPGDYQLTFDSDRSMLVIRDANSLRLVAFEPVKIREDSTDGGSALLIWTRGTQRVVYSLRIAELGQAFVYERPPAHGRAAEEARQTQAVPVVVAKK